MLVHGAKDERVPIKHMHELVDRMAAVGKKPEQIVVEKKEAHGFRDIDNNVNLYTQMLAFFDRHIGGKQATAHTPCTPDLPRYPTPRSEGRPDRKEGYRTGRYWWVQ